MRFMWTECDGVATKGQRKGEGERDRQLFDLVAFDTISVVVIYNKSIRFVCVYGANGTARHLDDVLTDL